MYVFNGDMVDRGDHACEIVLLVFALKLADPKSVYVNRGNHEEPHINIYSGFEEECVGKYDHRAFQLFHAAFVWLPFACVINGKALVLHGGIPSDQTVTLDDLRSLSRGPDVCSEQDNWGKEEWIKDMLWSDPHPDPDFRGSQASKRGAGMLWGEDVTWDFLRKEHLSVLVRSHQCVPNGVAVTHGGAVYTVFSASNYCGTSGNLGAVLIFGHDADRPTDTYQWDPWKDASMSRSVVSKRKSKEIRRQAAVHQASEYVVENKTALHEYFKLADTKATGVVSFYTWAQGMAQVLQVRMAWDKLVSGLVSPDDMDASCDGVRYERWLQKFSVELKGGCREWQDEVVGKITSAVLQSGGDLAKAFEAIDTDGSGGISTEEFRVAIRKQLPSLAVLSDAQLEAVVSSFDADGSGQVDTEEFSNLLNEHIARSQGKKAAAAAAAAPAREGSVRGGGGDGRRGEDKRGDEAGQESGTGGGGDGGGGGGGGGGEGGAGGAGTGGAGSAKKKKGPRDGRAVIGLQWDTRDSGGRTGRSGDGDDDVADKEKAAALDLESSVSAASHSAMERMLADAISHLFFTHRRELFHVWHRHFDVDGTGSISAEDFVCSVRVLDQAGGAGMLSESALKRLVAVLDTNGDGRIDFMEFSRNIGRLVERVRGSR